MEDRLRKFARLVDSGSFTKAAADMYISQPALSAAISKLERELKTLLLVRSARPLKLTEAGKLAYDTAKELGVSTTNLTHKLAVLASQPITLSMGMVDSLADAFLRCGPGFTDIEQQASVSLTVDNSRYLVRAVQQDEVDVAFIVSQATNPPERLTSTILGSEPLCLVCHKTAYATAMRSMESGILANFISYDQASTTYHYVQHKLLQCGLITKSSFYSTSPEVMLQLVLAGKGMAVLPYLTVREHVREGTLVVLEIGNQFCMERPIVALKRFDKQLPDPVISVESQLKTILAALMSEAMSQ
jgi:DNA-binding transcriptional LysR family regulator